MGFGTAHDLATNDSLSLEQQIAIHFSSNCYPPVPRMMIPVAIEAINAYWEYDGSRVISLPNNVSFRGSNQVTAFEVIDTLRLEAWATIDEETE